MNKRFPKATWKEIRKMTLEELSAYQIALRESEFQQEKPLTGLWWRKIIHPICLFVVKMDRLFQREKLHMVGNRRNKKSPYHARIYACTHIGGNDVQRAFEAIRSHAWLFLGDAKDLYRDATGFLLKCNGVICCETIDKQDRQIAYARAVELLRKGGSLLIYPEGVWNTTENLPVRKLFSGTVKMAKESGAEIIPLALEQYDNLFFVNIGSGLFVGENEELSVANQRLRDELGELKFQIWETQPLCKRDTIPKGYAEVFEQEIISRCDYEFSRGELEQSIYRDKNITTKEEAFAFMEQLIPRRENAFLWRRN